MIYLTGITIANGTKKRSRKFKQLKIPFKCLRELEAFRISREYKLNPDLIKGNTPEVRVYTIFIEK